MCIWVTGQIVKNSGLQSMSFCPETWRVCILLDASDADRPWTAALEMLMLQMGRGKETQCNLRKSSSGSKSTTRIWGPADKDDNFHKGRVVSHIILSTSLPQVASPKSYSTEGPCQNANVSLPKMSHPRLALTDPVSYLKPLGPYVFQNSEFGGY